MLIMFHILNEMYKRYMDISFACRSHLQIKYSLRYVFTYYGENSSLECPKECQERRCHITDGTCLDCLPGYYGETCSFQCPHNCRDRLCHAREGTCFGCEPGYLGPICNRGTSLNYTFCTQQILRVPLKTKYIVSLIRKMSVFIVSNM